MLWKVSEQLKVYSENILTLLQIFRSGTKPGIGLTPYPHVFHGGRVTPNQVFSGVTTTKAQVAKGKTAIQYQGINIICTPVSQVAYCTYGYEQTYQVASKGECMVAENGHSKLPISLFLFRIYHQNIFKLIISKSLVTLTFIIIIMPSLMQYAVYFCTQE